VYAPDLPGQGQSDPAPDVDSVVASALVVEDFIDSMRIRGFDLVAHTEGCAVARRLIAAHPQAVRRVVLINDPSHAATPAALPVLALSAAEADVADAAQRISNFFGGSPR
jgi:pimeloyl-ACP methyl ester carboxylesterase